MRESDDDIAWLGALLRRSRNGAGQHLLEVFRDEQAPTAADVIDTLDDIFEMHLATVTADGAPLVAPLDGVFHRGRVWFGIPPTAVRAELVRRDARVSASYVEGDFAFIVHGTAVEVGPDDPRSVDYESLVRELYVARYGAGWLDWYEKQHAAAPAGHGFTGFIEPRVFFAKR